MLMVEEDEKSSYVKGTEHLKKQLETYLKIAEIVKKGTTTIEGKKRIEEEMEYFREKIKEYDARLNLHREGNLEGAMALKYALFHLGKDSDKVNTILNTQRLILADLEEDEKKINEFSLQVLLLFLLNPLIEV